MPAVADEGRGGGAAAPLLPCKRCRKPAGLCVCDALSPLALPIFVLILQHPQEQDRELGTAWLTHLQLANSRLVVGLSWRSLAAVLGRRVDPRRWGVLHLGPARPQRDAPAGALVALDGRGAALPDQEAALAGLDGIVLLDGSWSQAKALWWRNPWLLRLRRLVLAPPFRSAYGRLRREPRPDSLATIEAAGLALGELLHDERLLPRLLPPFTALLARYRALGGGGAVAKPAPGL